MRTFPTNFAAAFARRTGIAPLWLLKLTVDSVDYYLSDQAVTIAGWNGGVTTLPWVSEWGELSEELTGALNEIRVADMQVGLLVDVDASPNMETLALDTSLEASPCTLYLWETGLDASTDPPQAINSFYVTGVELPSPGQVLLTLEDEAVRLRQPIGEVVTEADWPSADPDDIGRIIPIPFGVVTGLLPVALDAGPITTLAAAATSVQTSLRVADWRGIAVGQQFTIGTERVYVTSVTGFTIHVTRAYGGTTAAAHDNGATVTEYRTSAFVWAASDRAVSSIDQVLCRRNGLDFDITDLCDAYTGQTGDQLSGYGARAVIAISQAQAESIRARCQVDLELADPGHLHTATDLTAAVTLESIVDVSGSWVFDRRNIINGEFNEGTWSSSVVADLQRMTPISFGGVPLRIRACCSAGASYTGTQTMALFVGGIQRKSVTVGGTTPKTAFYTDWYTITSWAQLSDSGTKIRFSTLSGDCWIWEAWLEVEYDPSTSDVPSNVTLSGNSVADTAIGGQVLVSLTAPDSAPADAMEIILARAGVATAVTLSGSLAGTYAFNGAIVAQEDADRILTRMALQCRSWFRMIAGVPTLIVRPDTLTSARTLSAVALDDSGSRMHGRSKTPVEEIINTINLRYDRDWSRADIGLDTFRAVSAGSDATSVATHGVRSDDQLFECDLVDNSTMADALRDFYLAAYADRSWRHAVELFLDQVDLEFGDVVTLGFAGSVVGQIVSAGIIPGNETTIDRVRLTVRV